MGLVLPLNSLVLVTYRPHESCWSASLLRLLCCLGKKNTNNLKLFPKASDRCFIVLCFWASVFYFHCFGSRFEELNIKHLQLLFQRSTVNINPFLDFSISHLGFFFFCFSPCGKEIVSLGNSRICVLGVVNILETFWQTWPLEKFFQMKICCFTLLLLRARVLH